MNKVKQILKFWFHEAKSPQERMGLWFGGEEKTDNLIREKFESDVVAAAEGKFSKWEAQPESCLALIILLDQFSLNIYRGQPKSFEINTLALPIALRALDQGYDRAASMSEKLFYYLPLEHAEDLVLQNRAVSLFKNMVKEVPEKEKEGAKTYLHFAKLHQEVIARFGRFPDRNEILGRPHTPEEAEYMRLGGPDF